MGNLSLELRDMARRAGLCDKWFGKWSAEETNESLFMKYKNGIDFSIDRDWISNDFIKSNWSQEVLRRNFIFVDDIGFVCDNAKGVVVVNGDSDVTFEFTDFVVADVYVRHHSKAHFNVSVNARVMINLYDHAEVTINSCDDSRVNVFRYSKEASIHDIGDNKCVEHVGKTE